MKRYKTILVVKPWVQKDLWPHKPTKEELIAAFLDLANNGDLDDLFCVLGVAELEDNVDVEGADNGSR